MVPRATWFDLSPDHGVLEIDEGATLPGPALELHVVVISDVTFAWWATDQGVWLRNAEVGIA